MSDKPKTDMVMLFKFQGQFLNAECALDKDPDDTMMTEFVPQTYDSYSNFFEVTKFEFGIEVKDDDTDKSKANKTGNPNQPNQSHSQAANQSGKANTSIPGGFVSWRSAKTADLKNIDYPIEFDNFSFSRLIDATSPIFFQACCKSQSFDKAILCKRVSQGGTKAAITYLKIEFQDVLITSIDWDDGDVTTETCKFICKHFELTYRQQQADGSLTKAVSAKWDYKEDARRGK